MADLSIRQSLHKRSLQITCPRSLPSLTGGSRKKIECSGPSCGRAYRSISSSLFLQWVMFLTSFAQDSQSQKWTYQARNATYHAIKGAGFNEQTFQKLNSIVMVSEPEAAALHVVKSMRDEYQQHFLKVSLGKEGWVFMLIKLAWTNFRTLWCRWRHSVSNVDPMRRPSLIVIVVMP